MPSYDKVALHKLIPINAWVYVLVCLSSACLSVCMSVGVTLRIAKTIQSLEIRKWIDAGIEQCTEYDRGIVRL